MVAEAGTTLGIPEAARQRIQAGEDMQLVGKDKQLA